MNDDFRNSVHPAERHVQDWGGQDRRTIAVDKTDMILSQLGDMKAGIAELRESVAALTTSMTRLAIAEERIAQVNEALGRSFKALDKVEVRVTALETAAPINNQASAWVMKALWALSAAALMYVAIKTGATK